MAKKTATLPKPSLLTIEELAKELRMSYRGIQDMTANRTIPVIRIGRRFTRYSLPRVLDALARFEVKEVGCPR